MGTKERRARELAAREELFLDAARQLIEKDGLLNLQMSRIPEMCDYAVGTFYQHFGCKEDLLVTLAAANSKIQLEIFRKILEWQAPTRDRMLAMAIADVLFVREYPEHYRITQLAFTQAVWAAASPERRADALQAGRPIGDMVNALVQEAIDSGDIDAQGLNPSELALPVWSMTVGMHAFSSTEGLLEQYKINDSVNLVARHLQALLNGLGWQPLFELSRPEALEEKMKWLHNEVLHEYFA